MCMISFIYLFLIDRDIVALPCCVYAVQQSESAMCIPIAPLSGTSLTSPHPTHLGHHTASSGASCAGYCYPSVLDMVVHICQSHPPYSPHFRFPPLPPPHVHMSVLGV